MQFAATPPYDGTLSTFYCLPEDAASSCRHMYRIFKALWSNL
jgi:hypothetical protein